MTDPKILEKSLENKGRRIAERYMTRCLPADQLRALVELAENVLAGRPMVLAGYKRVLEDAVQSAHVSLGRPLGEFSLKMEGRGK